jgi:hypothetical protein
MIWYDTEWALAVVYGAVNYEFIIATDAMYVFRDISVELRFCSNILTWIDIPY